MQFRRFTTWDLQSEDISPPAYDIPFTVKIERIHRSLHPYVDHLVKREGHQPVGDKDYLAKHGRIRHLKTLTEMGFAPDGQVDLGKLLDLKAVFEYKWTKGIPGLTDGEFSRVAGPLLLEDYPHGLSTWVATIDDDSSGFIDWAKLSTFLLAEFERNFKQEGPEGLQHASGRDTADMEYHTVPKGYDKNPTGFRITKLLANRMSGLYLGYCTDGSVRLFDPDTLNPLETIHRGDRAESIDVKISPESDRLYVAQPRGYIFMYDTSGERHRTGNLLRAFRVQPHTTAIETTKKTVPYSPLRMEMVNTGILGKEASEVELSIPVVGLDTKSVCTCGSNPLKIKGGCVCKIGSFDRNHLIQCIEPTRNLLPPPHGASAVRDPYFLVGFEGGHVAMYPTDPHCGNVANPNASFPAVSVWHPHKSFVTKIMTCAQGELFGWLSSSRDGTIQLMDVVKQETTVRLEDKYDPSSCDGGWLGGVRPVTSFDVSTKMPLIASCSMRMVTIWSPAIRRKVATFSEHKGAVLDVAFNDEMQHVISLGQDRTIRVWDVRAMKCLQVIQDKERRRCQEQLSALAVDQKRNAIIACGGTPFVWHNQASETRVELGVEKGELVSAGHTDRIRDVGVNVITGHVVTSCGSRVLVWELESLLLVRELKPSSRVLALAVKERQTLLGMEDGTLEAWSHVSGKKLRILRGCGAFSSLLYVPPSHDDNYIHSAIVGACGTVVYFYPGEHHQYGVPLHPGIYEEATYGIDVLLQGERKANYHRSTSAEGMAPIATPSFGTSNMSEASDVISVADMSLTSSGRSPSLAVGLTSGMLVFVGISSLTGPQVTATANWNRPTRQISAGRYRPQKSTGRPTSTVLWQRAASAARTTEHRLGSAKFTKFKHEAQQLLLNSIDALVGLPTGEMLVVYGNGDGTFWRNESQGLRPFSCVPLSRRLGESVCLALAKDSHFLFVGESNATVSVFDTRSLCSPRSSVCQEYYNDVGIQLVECAAYGVSTINALAVAPAPSSGGDGDEEKGSDEDTVSLVVGLENSSVILIDPLARISLRIFGAAERTTSAREPFPSVLTTHRFYGMFPEQLPGDAQQTFSTSILLPSSSPPGSPLVKLSKRSDTFPSEEEMAPQKEVPTAQQSEDDRHLAFLEHRFPYLTQRRSQSASVTRSEKKPPVADPAPVVGISQKTIHAMLKVKENRERRARSTDKVSYTHLKLSDVSFAASGVRFGSLRKLRGQRHGL